MEKIVIIGSAGAGKTTLALKLGSKLHTKVVHLDRIFWERDWKGNTKNNWRGKTMGTRIDILEKLVQEKQWIIEGSYIHSSEPRLLAADTIIFLETSPLVCLLRIIRRHHPLSCLLNKITGHQNYHRCSRRDIPEGCADKLTMYRIFKVFAFPFQERRTLEEYLCKFSPQKVIRLHSSKDVQKLVANWVE
jgi:shikimate kinase